MTLTCREALHLYYEQHIMPKQKNRERAERIMFLLIDFFQDELLSAVDIPACRDYREWREGITDATVRRELSVLVATANFCRRWRKIEWKDMPSIELPPDSEPRRTWLFKEELAEILVRAEEMDPRAHRFIQLAYHTAARKNAIETLEWCQVDIPNRRIDLAKAGAKRTKKRKPIVAISQNMADILASMKTTADNQWVLGYPGDIRGAFDRVAKAADLEILKQEGLRQESRLTPHILRHTRATHLLQDGQEPYAVANLLGDTVDTLLERYGHACSKHMEKVVS